MTGIPWGYVLAWRWRHRRRGAWLVYRSWLPARREAAAGAHRRLLALGAHKFYVDELYDFLVIRPFTRSPTASTRWWTPAHRQGGGGRDGRVLRRAGAGSATPDRQRPELRHGDGGGLLVSIGVVLTWVLR
jgi:hypothetical protein